ncbi:MAG: PHP domain-containing protein, partial [Candidatus Omnitrophica bacterium]|nr:PHP domain-containing protein [Candidatus Omnitrophota bacterium]
AAGATHYTSSHSANYLYGRKNLAPDGAQLLPDLYKKYIEILDRIINKEIYGAEGGHKVVIAPADDGHILNVLTYEQMVKLFISILNTTEDDVKVINKAAEQGQKIVLNCLNGSTWKTLKPMLEELGIDLKIFDLMNEEENQFFTAGYQVILDKKTGKYGVDHFGIDTTYDKVIPTIPYIDALKGYPAGTMVFECDPDSDRFVLKQVMEKNRRVTDLLDEFGVEYLDLGDDKILAMPSPNKVFLALDIIDAENLKAAGKWDNYTSLYYITYVSTRAWAEFGDRMYPNLVRIMEMVGFKNLTGMQRVVEKWLFDTNDPELKFRDQLGREIVLRREEGRDIRIHSKAEESGGRVAGTSRPCINILGQRVLAMPEKSAADATLSMLVLASKEYLANSGMSGNYLIMNFLKDRFETYGLKSKIDARLDLVHGEQGKIALLPYEQQRREMAIAGMKKEIFNNLFFSIGRAVRDGKMAKEQVIEVLKRLFPEYAQTWECISELTLTEEEIVGGTRPEGAPFVFAEQGNKNPEFTELDFRPSGTDPLKSKLYIHAERLTPEQKLALRRKFEDMLDYDLSPVLGMFGIEAVSALKLPEGITKEDLGLKELRIGEETKTSRDGGDVEFRITDDALKVINFLKDKTVHSNIGYNHNVHREYQGIEQAILSEEKRSMCVYEHLMKKINDTKTDIKNKVDKIIDVLTEMKPVISAREKFIRQGIPVYHCHTNLKDDGNRPPKSLVDHAIKNGVSVLYVTGHDRIDGSLKAIEYASGVNHIIDMRPGVEIDTPFVGATAITHVVVVCPDDKAVIEKVQKIGERVFTKMQANYFWRFDKIRELGNRDTFDRAWDTLDMNDPRTADVIADIKTEFDKNNIGNGKEAKEVLADLFSDVRTYIDANPERLPKEFYNKLDVLGKWTGALEAWGSGGKTLWPVRGSSNRRKQMRSFFSLLYPDEVVEDCSKAVMERVDDLLEEFRQLDCRIVLAHPAFELFVAKEVAIGDHDKFWDKVVQLVRDEKLQAAGAAFSDWDQTRLDEKIAYIRKESGKTEKDFPIIVNIPDYHAQDYPAKEIDEGESITRGPRFKNAETGESYWALERYTPDLDIYFDDAKYLAGPYLDKAERKIQEKDFSGEVKYLDIAFRTDRYNVDTV